jgi:hypothetical protein
LFTTHGLGAAKGLVFGGMMAAIPIAIVVGAGGVSPPHLELQ